MYHIAVLTKSETQETFYREQLSRFCAEHGLFPRVDCYRGQEVFFEVARKNAPTNAVISLPGVDGLNAVEHLQGAFPGNAHHLVQRAGFFPACVPAARRLLSAGADNGRNIPAWALCMGRGKTTVCFAPSGSQPTQQGRITDEKEKPDLYCRQLPAGRSIDPVDGSLQRSTGTGGGHADAFRHSNTGCHSRTCRGNGPSAPVSGALPVKALQPKQVEENPYMAKSDANIHHDGYNTDSTDEILPLGIYPEIHVSYETTNANASPAIYFDSYGHAVVPLLGGIAIRDLNAGGDKDARLFFPEAA